MKITFKKVVGNRGESIVASYLKEKGYKILERNFRSGRNEIDVVAEDGNSIVFVEVKTTSSDRSEDFKLPREAVDKNKKERIIECARDYIMKHRCSYEGYRFDVVEVYLNRDTPEINHIENAFYKKERTYR